MESNCASQNQTRNLEEEKIMGIYWFRGLALAILFIFAGLFSPAIFHTLGIPRPKMLGDGSGVIVLALMAYVVTVLSVISLASSTVRSIVIPAQNGLFSFFIPLVVVLGYFLWGGIGLYQLFRYGI